MSCYISLHVVREIIDEYIFLKNIKQLIIIIFQNVLQLDCMQKHLAFCNGNILSDLLLALVAICNLILF